MKEKFIDMIKSLMEMGTAQGMTYDPDALKFWEMLQVSNDTTKPLFTDKGKELMLFLQSKENGSYFTAKQIADELFTTSRSVSGSIRGLVTDGYVEKISLNPTVYQLTEQGRKAIIE